MRPELENVYKFFAEMETEKFVKFPFIKRLQIGLYALIRNDIKKVFLYY